MKEAEILHELRQMRQLLERIANKIEQPNEYVKKYDATYNPPRTTIPGISDDEIIPSHPIMRNEWG